MINDLRAITLFVHTVEMGSFKRCAERFHLSPSIVSQQISSLEKKYATTLLYRSTRKLSLTPEGETFFEKAVKMVASANDALFELTNQNSEPSGPLRLTIAAGLIKSPLCQKVAAFAKRYPKVTLDIHFSDERVDLIDQGVDLAIRVGQMSDSALMSKKIACLERRLICTPDYSDQHPKPHHSDDLKNWDWIKMKMMPPHRMFIAPDGQSHKVPFQSQIEVDNVEAMCVFSREGLGLSTPPAFMVDDDIKSGRLIEVLPDWRVAPMDVYAVWPQSGQRRKLTALLIEEAFSL